MKTLTLTAAALVAAMLLGFAVQARGSSSQVIHLSVTGTKISTVDVPPLITSRKSPETAGDQIIAVSKVPGGHRYLVCTVTKTAPSIETALYACQVTYTLAGGTITAAGVVHVAGRATAAVTGGTGKYTGARGVLLSVPGTDTLTLQ